MVAIGVHSIFCDKTKSITQVVNLESAEQVLKAGGVALFITELTSDCDNIESTVSYLQRFRLRYPHLKLAILTKIADPAVLNFLAKAMPSVTLLRKTDSVELIQATLRQDESYRADLLDCWMNRKVPAVAKIITQSEFKLMKWFGAGMSLHDIGQRASISPKTVSFHRRAIINKLGCTSEAEFAGKLRKLGFSAH